MIVLDTNVVSELFRPQPEVSVVEWVDQKLVDELFLTAVTTAELRYGVARLPEGRRKSLLAERVQQIALVDFAGRVLAFGDDAADHYAQIVGGRERRGEPISMADAQIAAICRSHGASLATRNVTDFRHTEVDLVNPWH